MYDKNHFQKLCESVGGLSFGEVYKMAIDVAEKKNQFSDAVKLAEKIHKETPQDTCAGVLMAACLMLFVYEITGGHAGVVGRANSLENIRN